MSKRHSAKGNRAKSTPTNIQKNMLNTKIVLDSPFNPLVNYDVVREKISLFFEHETMTKNVSYFVFKGLEEDKHLIPFNINRMLYFRGGLVAFNYNDRKEILPFVINAENGLDYYGLPRQVSPVAYAQDIELLENITLTVNENCAIWLDTIPFDPSFTPHSRFSYNSIINSERTQALMRVRMSMIAHFEKLLLRVDNENQANKIRQSLRLALENGDPVAVVSEYFDISENGLGGGAYVGNEFFKTLKDYSSLLDYYNGITTSGFGIDGEKRIVAGELSGVGEQIDLMADLRLSLAEKFAKDCQDLLGWSGFEITTRHMSTRDTHDDNKEDLNYKEETSKGAIDA